MNHKLQQEKAYAGIATLSAAFPDIFNLNRPKPLAIGIHTQIADMRRAGLIDLPVLVQRAALKFWLKRTVYHRAMTTTGIRYNLDGSISGLVSDDHRQHAIDRLKKVKKAWKSRKVVKRELKVAA